MRKPRILLRLQPSTGIPSRQQDALPIQAPFRRFSSSSSGTGRHRLLPCAAFRISSQASGSSYGNMALTGQFSISKRSSLACFSFSSPSSMAAIFSARGRSASICRPSSLHCLISSPMLPLSFIHSIFFLTWRPLLNVFLSKFFCYYSFTIVELRKGRNIKYMLSI